MKTYSEDTFRFAEQQEFLDFKGSRAQNIFHSYLFSETERAAVLLT